MEDTQKQHDPNCPIVSYYASTRTFDRLFKEGSLAEMKEVVRRKLKVSSDVAIHLTQLRDGQTVDLEDDDDFEAFYSAAYQSSVVSVRVDVEDVDELPQSDKVKLSKKHISHSHPEGSSSGKKRRVSFAQAPADAEHSTSVASDEPKKKKRKSGADIGTEGSESALLQLSVPSEPGIAHVSSELLDNTDIQVVPKESVLGHTTRPKSITEPRKSQGKKSTVISDSPSDPIVQESTTEQDVPKDGKARRGVSSGSGSAEPVNIVSSSTQNTSKSKMKSVKSKNADGATTRKSGGETDHPQAATKSKSKTPAPFAEQLAGAISQVRETEKLSSKEFKKQVGKRKGRKAERVDMNSVTTTSEPIFPPVVDKTQDNDKQDRPVAAPKELKLRKGVTPSKKKKGDAVAENSKKKTVEEMRAAMQSAIQTVLERHHVPPITSTSRAPDDTTATPNTSSKNKVTTTDQSQNKASTLRAWAPGKTTLEPPTSLHSPEVLLCPICLQILPHFNNNCPLVLDGIKSIKKRLNELRQDKSEDIDGQRDKAIQELEILVKKGDRKKTLTKVNGYSALTSSESTLVDGNERVVSNALDPFPGVPKSLIKPLHLKRAHIHDDEMEEVADSEPDEFGEIEVDGPSKTVRLWELPDVSAYDNVDIETLISGPNASFTVNDIPSTDNSDTEDAELEEQAEEQEEETGRWRKAAKSFLRSSSDSSEAEVEDNSSDSGSRNSPARADSPMVVDATLNLALTPAQGTSEQGNVSFQEVDAQGVSLDVDRTGDVAFNEALAADTAIFRQEEDEMMVKNSQKIDPIQSNTLADANAMDVDQEGLAQGVDLESTSTAIPASPLLAVTTSDHAIDDSNPIEAEKPTEDVALTLGNVLCDHANDAIPLHSTPKMSQSNTKRKSMLSQPPLNPMQSSQPVLSDHATSLQDDTIARRTRNATRSLSQPLVQTQTLAMKSVSRSRSRRRGDLVAKEEKVMKVPSVIITRLAKTPAKKNNTAKGTKNAAVTPQASVNASFDDRSDVPDKSARQISLGTWEVLEVDASPMDTEATILIDELQSIQASPPLGKAKRGKKSMPKPFFVTGEDELKDDNAPQDPLFFHSSSQLPFPFSQALNTFSLKADDTKEASNSDSNDEDEVETVVARPHASHKPAFRRLTDIASQPTYFPPPSLRRAKSQVVKADVAELYGRTGGEDESDSNTDSDSASEEEQYSHIPKGRRAGVSRLKK